MINNRAGTSANAGPDQRADSGAFNAVLVYNGASYSACTRANYSAFSGMAP